LKQRQGLAINPVFGLRLPRPPRHVPIIVPRREIQALVNSGIQPETNFKEMRDNLIIQILFQTGIRRSELAHFKTKDIDFVQKQIKVFGKGSKERLIPFGDKLRVLLEQYIKIKSETFRENDISELLITMKGQKMAIDTIYVIVREMLGKLDLQKHNPHTLRHIFATQLYENGSNIQEIKELLGHINISTTEIYTHSTLTTLEKNYKKYFLYKKMNK
jgi:integrase/recombinase XerC